MRIGELAEASGTTRKTLRFYEGAGLLPEPERTAGGYRDYSAETLARLSFIRRGRTTGLTLAQIREILQIRDTGASPCQHVQDLLDTRLAELDRQIADLQTVRETVSNLRADAESIDPTSCDAADVCRYL